MVPNSMPVSHNPSAQPRTIRCTRSGRASVVKSRSATANRSSRASRTLPPTRYSSWPASANNSPNSRSTGACGCSALTAANSSTSALEALGSFDTFADHSIAAHDDITTRRQADHERECIEGESSTAATIAWVSEGERAKPRRRRGRRRGRRSAGPPEAIVQPTNPTPSADAITPSHSNGSAKPSAEGHKPGPSRRAPDRLRTVHETSAGGLVIDGIDGPKDDQVAALIGRADRRGRMLWSLPKGHIEMGETAEQTAIREVAEETGIQGSVLAALGSIDYWFVTEGRRVHKTVHHYLMRFLGGELCDEDVEVAEVAWVPILDLPSRLAYADERRLAEVADELIGKLQSDGPAALPPLPPSSPRRRPQTHSRARHADEPAAGRKNGHRPGP